MAKLKPLTYWLDLQKQYEKIIAETTDKEHKKVTKEALKIVKSKIREHGKSEDGNGCYVQALQLIQ